MNKESQNRKNTSVSDKPSRAARILQRKTVAAGGPAVAPPIVREVLNSPGQPLDAQTRSFFEPRFGHDFSKVRVHADERAEESAGAVNALAFTVGEDVVFQAGQYSPASSVGRELLAHELVHVVQQRNKAAGSSGNILLDPDSEKHEHEANEAAQGVMAGGVWKIGQGATSGSLQRQPAGGGKVVLSLPRQQLKALGNADINEIIDALPATLFNGQKAVVKRATVDGVQHVFELTITITPGDPPVTAGEAGKTSDLTPSSASPAAAKTVTHPISLSLYERIPDAQMTFFHELIHVRLIIDRYLPQDQQSQTYAKFSERLEMASDPALLAVTGTGPKREAVFDKFNKLRAWYKTFVPGFKVPPALDVGGDEERYRTLINEYFTNKEAQKAFKKTETNQSLGRRYKNTLRADLQVAAQDQSLFSALLAARERMTSSSSSMLSDFDLSDQLAKALTDLFDALDDQLQQIEKLKQSPPGKAPGPGFEGLFPQPNVVPGPGPDPRSPPVGIGGEPVKET